MDDIVQPDIDMNEVCALITGSDVDGDDIIRARDYIVRYGRLCAELTYDRVMREGPVRAAFLEFVAHWRDIRDGADGPIGRVVANVVADSAEEWAAEHYKSDRTALSNTENVQLVLVDDGD